MKRLIRILSLSSCMAACSGGDLEPSQAAVVADDEACSECLTAIPIETRNETNDPVSVTMFVATKTRHMEVVGVIDALEPGDVRRIILPTELTERLAVPSLFLGLNLPGRRHAAGEHLEDEQVAAAHGYIDLQTRSAASVRVVTGAQGRPTFTRD